MGRQFNDRPILIVGLPRSGTTWQFNVMSQSTALYPIFEPDNRKINPFSHYYLKDNHRFPVDGGNNEFFMNYLWKNIFTGKWEEGYIHRVLKYLYLKNNDSMENNIQKYCGYKIPKNDMIQYLEYNFNLSSLPNKYIVKLFEYFSKINIKGKIPLIKSVHCIRQLKWIQKNYNPKIVIITRKLPNLIASFLRLKMPDSLRGISASPLFKKKVDIIFENDNKQNGFIFHSMIIQACELLTTLLSYHNLKNDSVLINHEKACENPIFHYKNLFNDLNLTWSNSIEKYIEGENISGAGFVPQRRAEKEQIRYKDQLSHSQLNLIKEYAEVYNLESYL